MFKQYSCVRKNIFKFPIFKIAEYYKLECRVPFLWPDFIVVKVIFSKGQALSRWGRE